MAYSWYCINRTENIPGAYCLKYGLQYSDWCFNVFVLGERMTIIFIILTTKTVVDAVAYHKHNRCAEHMKCSMNRGNFTNLCSGERVLSWYRMKREWLNESLMFKNKIIIEKRKIEREAEMNQMREDEKERSEYVSVSLLLQRSMQRVHSSWNRNSERNCERAAVR